MLKTLGVAAVALAIAGQAEAQQRFTWIARSDVDALTDEVSQRACARTGEWLLCGSFLEEVFTLTILFPEDFLPGRELPAMRVDKNPYIPASGLGATAGFGQTWPAQRRPESGVWDADRASLVGQLAYGRELIVRVNAMDGRSEDVRFTLGHACGQIMKILPPGDRMECDPAAEHQPRIPLANGPIDLVP